MKINIMGHEYDLIEESPGMWSQGIGRSNAYTGKIKISEDITEEAKLSTLLHEVIHVISDLCDLPTKDDERAISVLAVGLFDFLRRNPDVGERLVGRHT